MFWQIFHSMFIAYVLFSCTMFAGNRTASTLVTSTPDGAYAYIIHEGAIYDALYQDRPHTQSDDGKTMTFAGTTPFIIDVPKGMFTKVLIVKEGYESTLFTVKAKKEASYFDGKNRECLADKYLIYATPFMVWDEFVSKYVLKNLNSDYCKEVRHAYHINLKRQ